MFRSLLFFAFILSQSFVFSQDTREIGWIENNLQDYVIIEGQNKSFSILEKMEVDKVPGASIAIVKNGEIVFSKGYGIANSKTGTTVNTHTLFQAGSISKPLATLAILHLVEKGKIDLDEDVNTYLKTWKVPENEFTTTEKVTLRRILTHTAGINVHGFPGYPIGDEIPSTEDVLNGEGNTPKVQVTTTPGSVWRYSGGGYTIMQQVVKDVSGIELSEYMEKYIFSEIGMTESTFKHPLDDSKKDIASAAYKRNGKIYKELWRNYPETAAAGLWTTPSDLAKYCIYIQNLNQEKITGLLSKNTIDQMLHMDKNDWGLGLSLSGETDSLCFGHGGKNAGFTNDFKAFAFKGDAIIVMTNGDNGAALNRDIIRAVSTFYDWNMSNYVYAKPISLKKTDLAKYIGDYSLEMGKTPIPVTAKGKKGKIILKSKQLPGSIVLTPIAENKFIDINRGVKVEFVLNTKNEVIEFIMNEQMIATKQQ